eukprot:PRCOL_00003145-RA
MGCALHARVHVRVAEVGGGTQTASERSQWQQEDQGPRRQAGRGRDAGEGRAGYGGAPGGYGDDAPRYGGGAGEYGREAGDYQQQAPSLSRAALVGEAVYGLSSVDAALSQYSRRPAMHALYVQDSSSARAETAAARARCVRAAGERGVDVLPASKHELNLLSSDRPHQGVVLDAAPLEFDTIDCLPPAATQPPGTVWLALDEVVDPQNLGAMLRTALFLGCGGVVTCARNSAPLSAAVSKASAGAAETMELHACRSMPRFLGRCNDAGWTVLGAAGEAGAVRVGDVRRGTGATLLVMGNEGAGLRAAVRSQCKGGLVAVDGGAPSGSGVDSLNVSVACGVLLHSLLHGGERSGAE